MTAAIIPFDFEEQAVRVVMRDDAPWFVAADVCRVLEHSNPTVAISRLEADEIQTVNLNTLNSSEGIRGNPNATIINESGLYALILTSRKPAAKRFRKWVTAEVLPALRSQGRYELPGGEPQMHEISADRLIELLQAENQLLRSGVSRQSAFRPTRRSDRATWCTVAMICKAVSSSVRRLTERRIQSLPSCATITISGGLAPEHL
ncbi:MULTISPECIES: BRO-N domain-containing protein [Paracoccus]|uniref:Prophage antirepressor-like protein n=1 Tax=Paracoccus versutus TaxID=34007 RepID=A0A3D9XGT9_PARVE|nr:MULTISPECIES: Bro-N domain-containing protein [Paracoccus]REF69737.1 prophage antirepressor-like protein [Paracoccus versutus]WGR57900.1 hypothetical protein E3U25_18305 [Paracoccus versutus]